MKGSDGKGGSGRANDGEGRTTPSRARGAQKQAASGERAARKGDSGRVRKSAPGVSAPQFMTRDRLLDQMQPGAKGRARPPATSRERLKQRFLKPNVAVPAEAPVPSATPQAVDETGGSAAYAAFAIQDAAPAAAGPLPSPPPVEIDDAAAFEWLDRNARFFISVATTMDELVENLRRNGVAFMNLSPTEVASLLRGWADKNGVRLVL